MSPADTREKSLSPLTEADIYPESPVLHERLIKGLEEFFGLPEDNGIRSSYTIIKRKYSPEPGLAIPSEGLTPYKKRCIALLLQDNEQPSNQRERIYQGTKYLQEPDARTLRIFETETGTTTEKALAHINFSPEGTIYEVLLWSNEGNHLTSIIRTVVETEERGPIQVIKLLTS